MGTTLGPDMRKKRRITSHSQRIVAHPKRPSIPTTIMTTEFMVHQEEFLGLEVVAATTHVVAPPSSTTEGHLPAT